MFSKSTILKLFGLAVATTRVAATDWAFQLYEGLGTDGTCAGIQGSYSGNGDLGCTDADTPDDAEAILATSGFTSQYCVVTVYDNANCDGPPNGMDSVLQYDDTDCDNIGFIATHYDVTGC